MSKPSVFKTSLVALSLSCVVASGSLFAHQDHQHSLRAIYRQLDLSEQQQQDLRSIKKQSRQDAKAHKQDLKQLDMQLTEVIQATSWDQDKATSLLKQKQQIKSMIALLKATNQHYLWNQLSEQQQAKYSELISEQKKPRDKRKNKPMRKFGPLNLTEQQQTQISVLLQQQRQQRQSLQESAKQFRQQQNQLVRSADFDQQAWLTSFQQMQSSHIDVATSAAYTRHQIWNMLDAEQQEIAERMAKKRNKKASQKRASRM